MLLADKFVKHAFDLLFCQIVLCGDGAKIPLLIALYLLFQRLVHDASLVAINLELLEVSCTALLVKLRLRDWSNRHGSTSGSPSGIPLDVLSHYSLQLGSFGIKFLSDFGLPLALLVLFHGFSRGNFTFDILMSS